MKSAMRTLTVVAIVVVYALAMPATADDSIGKEFTFRHDELGQVPVYRDPETKALLFVSQMHVNIDGAPDAYHPDDIGTCHICNGIGVGVGGQWKANCLPEFNKAKAEGFDGPTRIKWFGMATEDGKPFGKPVIQTDGDPNPGYFVSTTALQQPGLNSKTPQAQLNSNEVPFIVIPVKWNRSSEPGVKLGDFAAVLRLSNEKMAYAIVGDTGPNAKLGEGSVALHQTLGNDPFGMRRGKRRAFKGVAGRDVIYVIFPGSRKSGELITKELIDKEGAQLLEKFGGKERLLDCAKTAIK